MNIPKLTDVPGLYNSFLEFTTPQVDYNVLQSDASVLEAQALELESQVEQEANRLRESFAESVGTAEYGAARRGVKVGEGDIQTNIEESAGAVGKDIQTARGNVAYKGKQLRDKAGRIKKYADRKRTEKYLGLGSGYLGQAAKNLKGA